MFDGSILVAMEKFILQIFYPVTNFLNSALNYLDNVRLQPARLLNLDYFLGPVSILGPEWRSLIGAVIGSITILFMVFIAKGAYNLYLLFKQGVKWW